MPDEIPAGSRQKAHSRHAEPERGGEQSALQVRATFLQNWDWELIDGLNRTACAGGRAQHGHNTETHGETRREWKNRQQAELTFKQLLDFLRLCHRKAPFLFFNGNTFAEVARRSTDALLAQPETLLKENPQK